MKEICNQEKHRQAWSFKEGTSILLPPELRAKQY